MTEIEFSFEQYGNLLDDLVDAGYSFTRYGKSISKQSVLLRHDVDWSPRKAVRFAEIEAERDITATYFFLVSSPAYNILTSQWRSTVEEIKSLGHEIGLHFSVHQYFDTSPLDRDYGTQPPDSEVKQQVDKERSILESVTDEPIQVVSFHNPPRWVFGESYDDFISTYEERFFDTIEYRSDSVQRWRDEAVFPDGIPSKVQILTHPVLWGDADGNTIDRLREERDIAVQHYTTHLNRTFSDWNGYTGFDE